MTESRHYDAVIIGSGQGGKPLAQALANAGRRTAVVEREAVGGNCINWGCTPTKTMVASAGVAHLARRASDYGVEVGDVAVEMEAVRSRKEEVVASFREGVRRGLEETDGLDLLRGEARFSGPRSLEVALSDGGTLELDAGFVVIDTGARPRVPPVDGLRDIDYLDSTSVMELDEVPGHLLVMGGGYVGCEFAQMYRRFGSRVTLVQRDDQLLRREDPDVADAVAEILREDGIDVVPGARATAVSRDPDGRITLRLEPGEGDADGPGADDPPGGSSSASSGGGSDDAPGIPEAVSGTHLLVATGRVPNTDHLNLEAAGVETDEEGHVRVNERLETGVEGVYALGDVKGGPAFTHISYDDYRVLRTNLLGEGGATTGGRMVPYTVYIDPQLGRVGLSETEAREREGEIRVARMGMDRVARALETGRSRGFMKAVVDAETDRILGCAVLGMEGGELMSMLQIAMMTDLPYTALRDGIFAHPTLAESLNNLFGRL